MHLPQFIARRYLFAKKSHNVINIISLISAIGIAVGSCALIMVLSIYNGFEDVVRGMYDRAMPDIAVTCGSSKYFRTDTEAFDAVRSMSSVASFTESVEEAPPCSKAWSRATPRIPRYSPASSTESSP